jgi:N-acetylmuramic acid 6-phosphate etherase
MTITTEKDSIYDDLEKMSVREILENINTEDKKVLLAVEKTIPQIEKLAEVTVEKMKAGGRLFYIGAGTSGRLGVLDASECPPTFGVPFDRVIGIIAGGDRAIRKAVEFAEDNIEQAWKDIQKHGFNKDDVIIGVAASGTTPYVIGGLREAKKNGLVTGCIVCNSGSPVAAQSLYPVEAIVGPEFVSGSTRMKSGTAQKLILNMLSTSIMIKLGHIKGNKMVDMKLTNKKLFNRAIHIIMSETSIDKKAATELLTKYGSVRKAIGSILKKPQ